MRLLLCLTLILSACTPRTVYVAADCPAPPEIGSLKLDSVDTTLPANEQVRQIIINFSECKSYADQCTEALRAYDKGEGQ